MMEILFVDVDTGRVNFAVTDVTLIRHITPSEVGYTYANGRKSSTGFHHKEKLEVVHKS